MLRHSLSSLFLFALFVSAIPASHSQNLFANGGFETPSITPGTFVNFSNGANIGGWTVVGQQVSIVRGDYSEPQNGLNAFNVQEGQNALDLTGSGNNGLTSGVQQTLDTTIGQSYTLSFYVGRADGNSNYATPATVDVSINGGARTSFTNADTTPGAINWQLFTTEFIAQQASTTITFFNGTSSNNNNYVGLDNAAFSVVPAPGALVTAFIGIAPGAVLLLRRRRRVS